MISFLVDDIQATVDDLAKKGVRFYPDNDKTKTIFDVGPPAAWWIFIARAASLDAPALMTGWRAMVRTWFGQER